MAYNPIDYTRIPLQRMDYSGLTDFAPNLVNSYFEGKKQSEQSRERQAKIKYSELMHAIQEKYAPQQAEAELNKMLLGNEGLEIQNKYAPRLSEADIESKMAQAYHHRRSGDNVGRSNEGPTSLIGKLLIDQAKYAPGSREFKAFEAAILKSGASKSGVPGQSKAKQLAAMIAGKQSENIDRTIIQPFKGKDSNLNHRTVYNRYEKNRSNQSADEKQKKADFEDLVNAALANRIAAEAASAQLLSQSQKDTLHGQKEQKKAFTQGWAEIIPYYADRAFPEVAAEVQKRHSKFLKGQKDIASQVYSGFEDGGFSFGDDEANENQKMVQIYDDETGETRMVTEQQATALGI